MSAFKRALFDSFPVLCAYFPLGIIFGYLFVQMGFAWYWAPIMSAAVYGGSVQFLALSLLATQGTLLDIALGAFLLSLRNFFYGFAFLDRFKGRLWQRIYFMFGLVDATFALVESDAKRDDRYAWHVNWLVHLYWVAGTALGALIELPHIPYIDFALPALMAALAVDQWRKAASKMPFVIAAVAAGVALLIAPGQMLVVATFLTAAGLLIVNRPRRAVA